MKDAKEPLLILLVIFIIVGLAYGPIKNASKKGTGSGNSQLTTSSTIENQNASYSSNGSLEQNIQNANQNLDTLQQNLNDQTAAGKHSPYYGKISMSGVAGLGNPDPSKEYITLYSNLDTNETVKITGWYLKSEITGYYVTIGQASLLPTPFKNVGTDVILQKGDTVYLNKAYSPIGVSFRTNKCTGYFGENRTFTPSLPFECPLPRNEKLPQFSNNPDVNDECYTIIENLQECSTVSNQFIYNLPDTVPQSCKNYLTTQINYNSCVALHFSDTDFPGNKYYIYLNKLNSLWRPLHDTIDLYDQNNLVVASIVY